MAGEVVGEVFSVQVGVLDSWKHVIAKNQGINPAELTEKSIGVGSWGHPGETVKKRRVRSKVWWPLIDRDVEIFVKACRDCNLVSKPLNFPPMT